MKSIFLLWITLAFLSIASLLISGCGRQSESLPNFIIIFIDDLGYADIGPFGSEVQGR